MTRPDIPYTLYIADSYLLLVPRKVQKVHPNFPKPDHPQQYKLQLTEYYINEYKKRYNSEPEFHYKTVEFGMDDDEVLVAALLEGSSHIPYWEFSSLFKGEMGHCTDQSSDPKTSFGLMKWDLDMAAKGPDA